MNQVSERSVRSPWRQQQLSALRSLLQQPAMQIEDRACRSHLQVLRQIELGARTRIGRKGEKRVS
jgi:hypothetical protein